MSIEVVVLGLTAILNLLVGGLVYLKNPRGATNRLFFMLTAVFVIWSVVNYISVHPVFWGQLTWIRLVLFCGGLLNLSLFLTFLAFPFPRIAQKYHRRVVWATTSTLLVILLTLSPLVFRSLKIVHSSASPVPGPGIVLFLAQTLILVGLSMLTVITRYRSSQALEKDQLRLVILGVVGTFTLILSSNFLLVVFFHITALVPFGPAFTLVFSFAFAYAIAKHHLFDIRRTAARGMGYVLTIGFIAFAYSVFVFGLSSLLLNQNVINRKAQIIDTLLAIILALSFQTIKHFFDKLSGKIFFKDSYDPQKFLDDLNQLLVGQVELSHIVKRSIITIESNLKSSGCVFIINKTAYVPERVISSSSALFKETDLKQVLPLFAHFHQKVIVADYLDGDNLELRKQLNEKDMAVVVRLALHLGTKLDGLIGEIVLGPKRNGDPYNKEDIQVLEIIANELVIAIQNALRFEEIENFNLTLQAKVNDATRKLRRVNEKLKALDETKDDFISMASHQLRTPLTSVKGYLSMVLEGDTGKITASQQKMLGQAFFSSQRMVYLIADLLNVSRLKTGKFVIDYSPVNLAEVVGEELNQLTETAVSRQLTLDYNKPKSFPIIQLDETKTRQVIMNFVDNAIYYTPSGGHVTVKLLDTPTTVELRVEDNGIGVPKAEQHHLFSKFYRAGNARKARPDGTGLGLFMAKKVIIAQNGSLIFDSKEGKGSTFGFVFNKSKIKTVTVVPEPKTHRNQPTTSR